MKKTKHIVLLSCYLFLVWDIRICRAQQQEDDPQPVLDASEKEAFYQVMESLNYEWNWRNMLPDPCGINALQGMACDSDVNNSSLIHFTELSFGDIQSNTPSCSSNATIHPSISKLSHLRSLSFFRCFYNTNNPATVPKNLANSLTSLTFQNNEALVGVVPTEIGDLILLERLVISGNGLSGELPNDFSKLGRLQQLVISRNSIRGNIPSTLGSLRSLVILDLSSNHLESSIPPELGSLVLLKKLDFGRNRLTGEVPNTLAGLKSLELMDLSRNSMNGSFPKRLLELNVLKELYLNGNQLLDLPNGKWGNMRSLTSLDLSDSAYDGSIPDSLGDIPKLRYLGLSNNRFAGPIPDKLANLPELNEINLSYNLLSGRLPFSPEFARRLGRNLKLKNNTGLCYTDSFLLAINGTSSSSLLSSLSSCKSTSLPVAFQGALPYQSTSMMSSSSQQRQRHQLQIIGAVILVMFLASFGG